MYDQLLIVTEYRRCSHCHTIKQLTLSLLMALLVHLLLIRFSAPLEKHDEHLQHRASLLEVELVMSAEAKENIDKKNANDLSTEPEQTRPKTESVHKPKPSKPKPVITQKPHAKAQQKPIPDKKTPAQAHPVLRPESTTKTPSPAVINIAAKNVKTETDNRALQAEKNQLQQQYLTRIMRIIQSHKQYPYSARRRRIEGDIQISFSINASGYPDNIQVNGKHAVLCSSTRSAITASLPFPPPPAILGNSTRVSFTMRYRLIN